MDFNFSAFQEPRGVMRVLHLIFSICAFATITGYSGSISFSCNQTAKLEFSYPFTLVDTVKLNDNGSCTAIIRNDFSSDSRFFVSTGVLAMLYSLAIMFVYVKLDEAYKANKIIPLSDFLATVFLAVLWISSSAAWAHGLTGLKTVTENPVIMPDGTCCPGGITTSSFSTLNISVIFGFLNFFLWAADLWFLYKETDWFQGTAPTTTSGV
ncbi:unnamed protein product [Ceutorhynchus assimilis]|uniref:MARVEL domain-containing protein n=1 Tax=Ceutorhynchus assimilis TaxID=467358 RepID=A0A9N9MFK8_9CUCU|nr:unnamed protein product [Ceutorhynchus assimilis]